MASKGWIMLHRKIQECSLWDSYEEPFDRRSAWIDLLLLANHEDKEIIFKNKPIMVKAGQRITSIRILAERWHWSVNRTKRYLDLLESMEMIKRDSDNHRTLLTIVKYEVYQCRQYTDEHTDEYTDDTQMEHTRNTGEYTQGTQTDTKQQRNNDNNDLTMINNDNNDNNTSTPTAPYQEIVDMYNEICVSYPRVQNLSDGRKKAIKARLKTYDLNDFRLLFYKAEESEFLKGRNDRNWSANFDWLIKDSNMAKVLDGNYENKQKNNPKQTKFQQDLERMARWGLSEEET